MEIEHGPEENIDAFLEALSSSRPTPGGGAVAGLTGALAAALSHMVASLTVGKKKYAAVEDEFSRRMPAMKEAMARFRALMLEDVAAFESWMAASRLPKASDEEKEKRRAALREATVRATEVPLETIRHARSLLPLVRLAAEKGNAHAVSDAGIAALLLRVTAEAAAFNVRINLAGLTGAEKERYTAELDALLAAVLPEADAIAKAAERRLGGE